jgi:hypothetical protein
MAKAADNVPAAAPAARVVINRLRVAGMMASSAMSMSRRNLRAHPDVDGGNPDQARPVSI